MIPRADVWVLGGLAVLALVVAWQWSRVADVTVDPERLEAAAQANVAGALSDQPPEYVAQVLSATELMERPLFWASRRPPEPEPEEEPTAAPPPPPPPPPRDLTVTGVAKRGDQWTVLIKRRHETIRLQAGETLDGWTVEEVTPDRVRLRAGRSTVDLPLYDPPVAPPPVEPVAQPPSARGSGSAVQSGGR
jgi:hypothetical protein